MKSQRLKVPGSKPEEELLLTPRALRSTGLKGEPTLRPLASPVGTHKRKLKARPIKTTWGELAKDGASFGLAHEVGDGLAHRPTMGASLTLAHEVGEGLAPPSPNANNQVPGVVFIYQRPPFVPAKRPDLPPQGIHGIIFPSLSLQYLTIGMLSPILKCWRLSLQSHAYQMFVEMPKKSLNERALSFKACKYKMKILLPV